MHNLGLGGLEFNPTHTIDEHRPVGFKYTDNIIVDDVDGDSEGDGQNDHRTDGDQSKTIIKTDANDEHAKLDLDIRNSTEKNVTEPVTNLNGVNGTSVPHKDVDGKQHPVNISNGDNNSNGLTDDMWKSELWQENVFKIMHDPKHRHPRHHGKCENDIVSCLGCFTG